MLLNILKQSVYVPICLCGDIPFLLKSFLENVLLNLLYNYHFKSSCAMLRSSISMCSLLYTLLNIPQQSFYVPICICGDIPFFPKSPLARKQKNTLLNLLYNYLFKSKCAMLQSSISMCSLLYTLLNILQLSFYVPICLCGHIS